MKLYIFFQNESSEMKSNGKPNFSSHYCFQIVIQGFNQPTITIRVPRQLKQVNASS